jgi:prepilin-type N-terminal cleavage/methylation domain-containing protein
MADASLSGRDQRKAFTLVELLVVIGIIAVLVAILLPSLGKARAQANVVACASNIRQLTTCMLMYEQDYKGKLIVEWTNGPLWPYLLKAYFAKLPNTAPGLTQTRDSILQCPMATDKPSPDSDKSPSPSPFQPYYTDFAAGSTTNNSAFIVQCAYGMNRYLYDASLKNGQPTWNKGFFAFDALNPAIVSTNFWKLQKTTNGSIPLLMDCRWREVYVDKNTEDYYPKNKSDKGMSLIATRRHGRVTNVAFTDLSVRTVPLPELWSFRWRPDWTAPATLPKVPW